VRAAAPAAARASYINFPLSSLCRAQCRAVIPQVSSFQSLFEKGLQPTWVNKGPWRENIGPNLEPIKHLLSAGIHGSKTAYYRRLLLDVLHHCGGPFLAFLDPVKGFLDLVQLFGYLLELHNDDERVSLGFRG
jgi:hypothetical protein